MPPFHQAAKLHQGKAVYSGANTRVLSLNPAHVTIKAPLVRKARRNHLIRFTSLEKLRALSLASAALKYEYVGQVKLGMLCSKDWNRSPYLTMP